VRAELPVLSSVPLLFSWLTALDAAAAHAFALQHDRTRRHALLGALPAIHRSPVAALQLPSSPPKCAYTPRARTHHVGGLRRGGTFYPTVSLLRWRGDSRDSRDGSGGSVDTGTKMEDIVLTVMGKEDRLTNALRV
jgi:hypothetical protein